MVISSLTALQFPCEVEVKVSVTEPLAISTAEGVYIVLSAVFPGLKLPVPPVHCQAVATVPVPFKVTSGLLAQTVWSAPASTVGAGVKVTVILSVTGLQDPFPVVVKYSFSVPAAISAAVGV